MHRVVFAGVDIVKNFFENKEINFLQLTANNPFSNVEIAKL